MPELPISEVLVCVSVKCTVYMGVCVCVWVCVCVRVCLKTRTNLDVSQDEREAEEE